MLIKRAFFVLILTGFLGCSGAIPTFEPAFVSQIRDEIAEKCTVGDCFVREVVYELPPEGKSFQVAYAKVTRTNNGFKFTSHYAFVFVDNKVDAFYSVNETNYDIIKARGKVIDLD